MANRIAKSQALKEIGCWRKWRRHNTNVTNTMQVLNCLSKWMNVLLLLILLFYSNRLCVLTSHILLDSVDDRSHLLCFFLHITTFCVYFEQPLHRIVSLTVPNFVIVVRPKKRYKHNFQEIFNSFMCVFFYFLHVRRKGLRSWFHFFFFRFFFNVNRWHFLFLLYNVCLKAIFFWMTKCERWIYVYI